MTEEEKCSKLKERVKLIFQKKPSIFCPYFNQEITLNSDGFHHLQFSSRRERNKNEQILKFSLVPLAINIIKKSGTIQEYRRGLCSVGKRSEKDGLALMKMVEYWGLVAITGNNSIKIRVILRRVGDGKIIFWSVMPAIKLSQDRIEIMRHLAKQGIEDD